ncbi:MAG: DUF4394 domain-containing protein [Verrucomicrobiales bacterium]|nr:DUF4394 domain-containing protein [Verrucomicrobiales bacterium]
MKIDAVNLRSVLWSATLGLLVAAHLPAPAQNLYVGLSTRNALSFFSDDGAPAIPGPSIRGLLEGESVVALDFRPFTGELYALARSVSDTGRLLIVSPATGESRAVALSGPVLGISGAVDLDFNPAAVNGTNALRIVTGTGQNYRLVFNADGAVVNVDTPLNAPAGAPLPQVIATAYSNNRAGMPGGGGEGGTVQYALDAASDQLYRVNPPNAGVLTAGGSLGIDVNVAEDGGFDIPTGSARGLAVLRADGSRALYSIDLSNGAAMKLRPLDDDIVDLASPIPGPIPIPVIWGLTETNSLVRFTADGGAVVAGPLVLGLASDETLVAIDVRPLTGELFGLTRDASNLGRLYRVDTVTGQASPVTLAGPSLLLSGEPDIDFNPAALSGVNALRIVTSDGANYRLVFDANGATVNVDISLNLAGASHGAVPRIVATAYANNRAGLPGGGGMGGTTQYALDSESDLLYRVSPPNAGILTNGLPLGFDIGEVGGLDIDTTTDRLLALVTIQGRRWLAQIDALQGGLLPLRSVPGHLRDLAIPTPVHVTAPTIVGLTATNSLVFLRTDSGLLTAGPSLSGFEPGQSAVAVDFRPFTGDLYVLARDTNDLGLLYTANPVSGVLSSVPLSGPALRIDSAVGMDFNPAALGGTNALRIVTASGQNYRLVFGSMGATVNMDTPLNLSDGSAPRVIATAYSNNRAGLPGGLGAGGTVQYAIDADRDVLFRVNPPNGGVLIEPRPLGIDVREVGGLDIATESERAFAVLEVDGARGLYDLQLASGAPRWIRALPANVVDLAVPLPVFLRPGSEASSFVAFGGIGPFAVQRSEAVNETFRTEAVVSDRTVPLDPQGASGFVRLEDLSGVEPVRFRVSLSGEAERPLSVDPVAHSRSVNSPSQSTR